MLRNSYSSPVGRQQFAAAARDDPNDSNPNSGVFAFWTKDAKWLERAKAVADFAESWIWIWNLPMPIDADDSQLYWKKGVPTIGIQGITALHAGSADEYLDWAVPSYAKLYNYTHDEHYLDVARVVLHDTKSMVALPGRQYDVKGIGWQRGLAHGSGRPRPRRRRTSLPAPVDFSQPPLRNYRPGGVRPGSLQETVCPTRSVT